MSVVAHSLPDSFWILVLSGSHEKSLGKSVALLVVSSCWILQRGSCTVMVFDHRYGCAALNGNFAVAEKDRLYRCLTACWTQQELFLWLRPEVGRCCLQA